MSRKIGSEKKFRSGELAEVLGVTIQSISNFRCEGMPYHSFDGVGYLYTLTAIKWFFMFKSQSTYENKRYKNYRKLINDLQIHNKKLTSFIKNPLATEKQKEIFIEGVNRNKKYISIYYSKL